MKKFLLIVLFVFSYNVALNAQEKPETGHILTGNWLGKLSAGGMELRIVLKIKLNEKGELVSLLDSPDQGANDIPTGTTTFKEQMLTVTVPVINGEYSGKLESDNNTITGNWKQGNISLPLNMKRSVEEIKLNRPQEPKGPFPYIQEELSIENKEAGIVIAGTLTYPDKSGKYPLVILISGSGSQDRDESLMGHKPFLVLSDYLSRSGIAVFRYDDRGVGKSTGSSAQSTSLDYTKDVLSLIDYFSEEKNFMEIGLIGHSEGGMIAVMAANRSDKVKFVVSLAGIGITGEEILILQSKLINKAMGKPDKELEKDSVLMRKLYKIIKTETDSDKAEKELRAELEKLIAELPEAERKSLGDEKLYVDTQIKMLTSPWFRYFVMYNPEEDLLKLKQPILVLIGEKDLQVPPKENFEGFSQVFEKSGKINYELIEMPGLNHLFQTAETGTPLEYSQIEETISPDVLKKVKEWIVKRK